MQGFWRRFKKKFRTATIEWYRQHHELHHYTMKQIYHLNNISKQAHLQAVGALQRLQIQEPLYLNLIEEARIMHP